MKKLKVAFLLIAVACVGLWIANEINGFLKIHYQQKITPETYSDNDKNVSDSVKPLGFRLVDMGGVGILPDTAHWGNSYELNEHRFEDLILIDSPFVDSVAFQRIEREFKNYAETAKAYNYNGIVIPGFLELVNFDSVGNGYEVYGKNSSYRQRHLVMQKYFSRLLTIAHNNQLMVYMASDMTMFTTPLKNYLTNTVGKIDTENKTFWSVYQAGEKELFAALPAIDGMVIRIGEGGGIYNRPGWDYFSELNVTTDKGVQAMLNSFLEVAEAFNKLIIFRSWTVGVGQMGDLHTNVKTYHRVLDTIQSNHLIVSTKYCSGDFYSWLPFNPSLSTGAHRRITEFQCRREFEGMNAFPNYMGPLYQASLQRFAKLNHNFDGFWLWTQHGGPFRAGPMSLYPYHGFNVITDVNVYATGRLAQNPFADLKAITADWVKNYLGNDSLVVNNVTELLLMSHDVTRKGLYIGEFAKYDVRALGLEPPPMMWIFEWDMVGASSSALGSIYYICKPNLEAAVAEGYAAIEGVKKMKTLAQSASGNVSKNKYDFEKLLASIDYQLNLFTVLAEYRNYFLHYYHWLDTGDRDSFLKSQQALTNYRELEKVHQQKYLASLDFPSYNFREANVGATVATRNVFAMWASRLLVVLVLLSFIFSFVLKSEALKNKWGLNGIKQFGLTLFVPSKEYNYAYTLSDKIAITVFLFIILILGVYVFTSFSGVLFFSYLCFLTVVYSVLLMLFYKTNHRMSSITLLAPSCLILFVLLVVSSSRGPMLFWYLFWTSENFKLFFFSVFVVCLFWIYYVLYKKGRASYAMSRLKSIATIIAIQGILFFIGAAIVWFVGFEKTLTLFNDELLILPGGLSRILGITVHLNIPLDVPVWVMYIGVGLVVVGSILLFIEKQKRKTV